MSLEIPELDDTSYDELVSNAKDRIAARTDEWTDFNPHDPGITILELLAWLADTHIYEADQLTDEHRKKYLRLLGVEPTPPEPASVLLDVSPTGEGKNESKRASGASSGGRLPAGTRLRADDGHQQLPFETDHPLHVTDSSVEAIVVNGEARTHANETDGMYYRLFGDEPTAGDWLAVGFDGDPFDGGQLRLFVEYADSELPEPPADEAGLFEPSVELCWEYCRSYPSAPDDLDNLGADSEHDNARVDGNRNNDRTDSEHDNARVDGEPADWKPLEVREDTTNSLYEGGFITFERPEPWEPTAWGSEDAGCFDHQPGVVWIRCRLTRGGYEIPPQCTAIKTNVVAASHSCEHDEELRPTDDGPTGGAPRSYQFERTPVLSATVTVDGEQWTEVSEFDSSRPTDCHYVLDRTAGELTVGDGQRGSQPPAGATVRARYEAGGGTAGNVSESARWAVDDDSDSLPAVEIEPRGPATGGAAAEQLDAAIDRCRAEVETAQRAVTADDYGALAESTPGVRVARSTVCLPEADDEPIRVVVVPHAPADGQRPTPSKGFKQAVETHLDRHRLLGDRLDVRGPKYVGLTVELSVVPAASHTASDAQRRIERHLSSVLDPIGGIDGDGWPFGRSLSETDLEQTIRELPEVDDIAELTIRTVGDATATTDGRVLIDEATLFALDAVNVECRGREAGGGS